MRYNVSQLLKSSTGTRREYRVYEDIERLDPSLKPIAMLVGTAVLIRSADGVLVRSDLHTTLELTCSRCLTEFSTPVRFAVDEEFFPTLDIFTGARLPLPPDADPATLIDHHHQLDIKEVVRQSLMLAVPMVPVCRSTCKGLCPQCGQNWNLGPCECVEERLDPRLAVLKQLLDN